LVVRPRLAAVARLPALDRIDERELELAPLVLPGVVGRDGHRERPQLPRLLERSALARHPAHQRLDAAAGVAQLRRVLPVAHQGAFGAPVPIMESRVTSAASAFSSRPSVPVGRTGSTQYRISDEESHTRT